MKLKYELNQDNVIQALRLLAHNNPGVWQWEKYSRSVHEYAVSVQGLLDIREMVESMIRSYSQIRETHCNQFIVETGGAAVAFSTAEDGTICVRILISPEILMFNWNGDDLVSLRVRELKELDQNVLQVTVDV